MARKCRLILAILGLAAPLMIPGRALGHGMYTMHVPRTAPGVAGPTVDGLFGGGEYVVATSSSLIFYRPRYNVNPARIYAKATSTDFYLFIQGLPTNSSSVMDFVSVVFDVNHNGGRVPDSQDLLFRIPEAGAVTVQRGDGTGGFVADATVTGWQAARAIQSEILWNAELRIPLSLIGGAAGGGVVGFHVRHNNVRSNGDDFAWLDSGRYTEPNTWGDLVWQRYTAADNAARVDVCRVTQGLDYDRNAGVFYKLVCGKDVMIRAQLFSFSDQRRIVDMVFAISRPSPLTMLERIAYPVGSMTLNPTRYGYFMGDGTFERRIPGSEFTVPGEYRISVRYWLASESSPRELLLGTYRFHQTADFRIWMQPWVNRFLGDSVDWATTRVLSSNVLPSLREMSRLYPIRGGVGPMQFDANPKFSGLRYFLAPVARDDPSDTTDSQSDRRGRTLANDAMNRFNAEMETRDPALHADRYDRAVLCVGVRSSGGGQCQPQYSPPSSGVGFDSNPWGSGCVIAHELCHALWQLRATSPNRNEHTTVHSYTSLMLQNGNYPMFNSTLDRDIYESYSLMFWVVGGSWDTYPEGYEWNDMHSVLITLPRNRLVGQLQAAVSPPIFYLVGGVSQKGEIRVDYSQRLDSLPVELTPEAQGSPYALVFRDSLNKEIGRQAFEAGAYATPSIDGQTPDEVGLILAAPLPSGATKAEIEVSGIVKHAIPLSAAAPVVSGVSANITPQGVVNLAWGTTDADSPDGVRHNIYYQPGSKGQKVLVASGVAGNSVQFPTSLVAPVPDGRMIVEATDGFNSGYGQSNNFAVPAKAPMPAIQSPTTTEPLVAGVPILFNGCALDLTSGTLDGKALVWKDGTTVLGYGETVQAALAAGTHAISLTATGPTGLSDTARLLILVRADNDHDTLPDYYEALHSVLSVGKDDRLRDPDGDTLTNALEYAMGTDPCLADTDLDGAGDADEVRLGSNPRDAGSRPLPNRLAYGYPMLDFRIGSGQIQNFVYTIQAETPMTPWRATSNANWLGLGVILQVGKPAAPGPAQMVDGMGDGQLKLTVDASSLAPGLYHAQVLVTTGGGLPQLIEVNLEVPPPSASGPAWSRMR